MVHAVKLTWKLGFGMLDESQAAKCHAFIEAGYFVGSILFAIGTTFFFPAEGLENYAVGCRFYELGSVVFAALTLYTELDHYQSRRRKTNEAQRAATKRELLEQFLYCVGSFVFLVGTFMFDPPFVAKMSRAFGVPKSHVENSAAVMFMLGSFMFSFGAYVNALTIFEAPRMFRRLLINVTTFYMFGGLFFIAGTMGYVEAFEPNSTLKWCATWFYLVGCFFYCAGSFLAFVSTVARQQVQWERIQKKELKKRRRLVSLVGKASSAMPRALKAIGKKRSQKHTKSEDGHKEFQDEVSDDGQFELDTEVDDVEDVDDVDLEEAVENLTAEFAARDDEEEVFGAFWRSLTGAGPKEASATPATVGSQSVAASTPAPRTA